MYEKVEAALLSAYKKDQDGYSNVKGLCLIPKKRSQDVSAEAGRRRNRGRSHTDDSGGSTGRINRKYSIGDVVRNRIKVEKFPQTRCTGRKHVIIQAVREAERGMLIKEYENKREEIITATVLRSRRG